TRNLHDPARYHAADLSLGDVFLNACGHKLLDSQLQPALFGIHFKHLRLDRLPNLEYILRMIDAFFRADVADMNHALETFGKLNEGAEIRQTRNRSFDLGADGKLAGGVRPRIAESLFEAERDAPLGRVNRQNYRFYGISRLDNFAG